jgi:hypothetical protein
VLEDLDVAGAVHRLDREDAVVLGLRDEHVLPRVRAFTQDDAHVFCTEDQLAAECLKINDLILSTCLKIWTWPGQFIGLIAKTRSSSVFVTNMFSRYQSQ